MKIDSTTTSSTRTLTPASGGAARTSSGTAASADASSTQSGAAASDTSVSLSGLSSTLRSLAASGSADIDVAHVEAIRDAIKNGSLSIDTGKIADGILQTARDLLQTPKNG